MEATFQTMRSYHGDPERTTARTPLMMSATATGSTALLDDFTEELPGCSSSIRPSISRKFEKETEFNNSKNYYQCSVMDEQDKVTVMQPRANIHDADDTDIEEELSHAYSCKQLIVPSKSQVLYYVTNCAQLKLNHTGSELQVTDPTDFPLLDIWAEKFCDEPPVWIIESYGRRVAVASDSSPRSMFGWLLPCLRPRRNNLNGYQVVDWNGEIIGFYVLGEQIDIQDSRREVIAKCYCQSDNGDAWRIISEKNPSDELANLCPDGGLRFAANITLQMKILLIATLSRAISRRATSSSCFPLFR